MNFIYIKMLQLKMLKYILTLLVPLFFLGCDSKTDNTATSAPVTNVNTTEMLSSLNECNTQDFATLTSPTNTPMLVILLNYNNIKINSNTSVWGEKIFGKNDSQLNHYFQEVSNEQFEFAQATECKGIVSVTLYKNHPDASIDSVFFGDRVHPDLALALTTADEKISFDIYDTNGDAKITPNELVLTFIIAGYEDAYEGYHVTNGIWAHQYCTNDTNTPLLDGVSLMGCSTGGNYSLFGERHGIVTPHDATIGVIAHELGHSAFSLPDLYDTSGGDGGIGYFGLMGSGAWSRKNNSEYYGQTPTHMSAWSKVFNNWLTPDTSIGVGKTVIETFLNNSNVYKVSIDADNYYLIENRNNNGYDRGLFRLVGDFQGGLAIWKIDETIINSNIGSNTVNNGSSRGVDLMEAVDGTNNENNLFYDTNVDSFAPANITSIGPRDSVMTININ